MSSGVNSGVATTVQIDKLKDLSISNSSTYLLVGDSNELLDIYIEANITVEIVDLSISSFLNIHIDSGSNVKIVSVKHKASSSKYEVFVNGGSIDFNLDCITIATGADKININSIVRHTKPNSQSRQFIKSIGTDSSTTTFEGIIHIFEGAGGTNAFQQNKNMLLTNEATIYARPWLEIYADDVKCSHGSTTGMLSEEEIFYMRQRGIPLKVAQKLLIEGFALEIANRVDDEPLRERVSASVFEIIKNI